MTFLTEEVLAIFYFVEKQQYFLLWYYINFVLIPYEQTNINYIRSEYCVYNAFGNIPNQIPILNEYWLYMRSMSLLHRYLFQMIFNEKQILQKTWIYFENIGNEIVDYSFANVAIIISKYEHPDIVILFPANIVNIFQERAMIYSGGQNCGYFCICFLNLYA